MGTHRVYRERTYEFGQQLLAFRVRVALTQTALAEQIGVHRRSVQNWETGESYPKTETLQRLIAVFLRHGGFTAGHEHEEALTLWAVAAQNGPQTIASFDETWFAALLGPQKPVSGQADARLAASALPLVDWGEAVVSPVLQGREAERATLSQWVLADHCRMITIVGLGGVGKSSLAIRFAHDVLAQFDMVVFRSLQNGPLLAELLDQTIRPISRQQATPAERVPDKIAQLINVFRERRCLLILDNFESLLQPGALAGTYRSGYAEYGELLRALGTHAHQSCVLVTSREKLVELGPLEGRTAPVRALPLAGLSASACQMILEAKDIAGTADEVQALSHLYGGNPLALMLVAEPIRELFAGSIRDFLAAGDSFFNGVGRLLDQQLARSTPLEQAVLYALAIERELVPIHVLLSTMRNTAPQRDVLVALESLRRRLLVERALDQPAFTLQPVILEFIAEKLVESVSQEILTARPNLLHQHAFVQATTKEYLRRSQERLLAAPLLERLASASGSPNAVEHQLIALLALWRDQPIEAVGYGPGNVINLLRLLRGHGRDLDLSRLAIRQAYLQGVDLQNATLAGAVIVDSSFTETFDVMTAVAINSTGAYWAAAGMRGEMRIWAAGGLTLHRMWRGHADVVAPGALAFAPDGLLASGSLDGTITLWDVESGSPRWSVRQPGFVYHLAVSPDGTTLASLASGEHPEAILWDVTSGVQTRVLAHPQPVVSVAWSRNGDLLATSDVEGSIRLWETGTLSAADAPTLSGHTSSVIRLAFSPTSDMLASASWDSTVRLWDTTSKCLHRTLTGHTDQVFFVAWSPDGRTVASASRDRTICLWDVAQGSRRATLHGHAGDVVSVAFTPDGHALLSGSTDGTLRVWDVDRGQCIRVIQGHAVAIHDVDWSPDSSQLVSSDSEALLTRWDSAGNAPLQVLHGNTVIASGVRWSPDGSRLASVELYNEIRLWDAASGAYLELLRPADPSVNFYYDLAWSPDGRWLASGTFRRGMHMFDPTTQQLRWASAVFPMFIQNTVWGADGTWLAGSGDDGNIYVWDAADGTLLQRLSAGRSMIASVAASPFGTQLVVAGGSTGGGLAVWDATAGEHVRTIAQQTENIRVVAWGANERMLVSGDVNGALCWWDIEHDTCVVAHNAHGGAVRALRRSPDGTRLASCGDDGAIMLWNVRTGVYLHTLRRDRPYEYLDITDLSGITDAQRASLLALGAVEHPVEPTIAQAPAIRGAATYQQARNHHEHNLPFQPTSFLGRGDELIEVGSILAKPTCRLLTLLGPGGVGKTRLAVEVAAMHAPTFADGVAFVALASVDTPTQIVAAIGAALNLDAGQSNATSQLLGYLRERQMLLVLDNFEHLLDGAALIADMLAYAPRVTLLVTSRERLNLQAEWLFDVAGLTYPPDERRSLIVPQHSGDMTSYSAVQLFVQRARQIQPIFELSPETLVLVVRICQYVAGLPLAIELAAAAVRTLPLDEIEQQIHVNGDQLALGTRDISPRHRSLRAVIDHSWQLLDEQERAVLCRLAVFRGGWSATAAEQVAEAKLPALTMLMDKSLVRQSAITTPSLVHGDQINIAPEPRFTMLEPIREYALEQLAALPDSAIIRQRHAYYVAELAEAAASAWNSTTHDLIVELLRREHDNTRAALQWACEQGDIYLGFRLAEALWKFWRSYGYTHEGRVWLDQLLKLTHTMHDPATRTARASGLHAAAWLASDQHDFGVAAQLFEQSIELRQALDETEGETDLLINAARQARAGGQYRHATALLERALARQRAGRDQPNRTRLPEFSNSTFGQVLREFGLVLREQGAFVRAEALFIEGLNLHRTTNERAGMAFALIGLGDLARDQGDGPRVREYIEPSLATVRELGLEWAIGFALNSLALGACYEHDLARASSLIHESVTLFRSLKSPASLAEVLITRGKIERAQGDLAAAYATLTEALQFARAAGPQIMLAAALEEMANLLIAQNHAALAVQVLAAASALRAQMAAPVWPANENALKQTWMTARDTLGTIDFTATWAAAEALPTEHVLDALIWPQVAQ